MAVHTDDVAWYQSFLDWADLLRDGVLRPYRAGRAVASTPPAGCPAAGRAPSMSRPAARCWSSRVSACPGPELSDPSALRLWVQSDRVEARRRGIDRDGGPSHEVFLDEWEAE